MLAPQVVAVAALNQMGRTIPSFRIAFAFEKADFVSLWKLR
jgi:hypothetical protein